MRTNVLGGELKSCCHEPLTGFYRDGYCRTGPGDHGQHTVCIQVTAEFLEFSRMRWCLCVERWAEALRAGCAPQVVLEACHISALEYVDLEDLKALAIER